MAKSSGGGKGAKPGYQSQAGYNKLPSKNFALPKGAKSNPTGDNKYPMQDRSHAANARARVMQNGTPAEQKAVFKATAKKYPDLGGGKKTPTPKKK